MKKFLQAIAATLVLTGAGMFTAPALAAELNLSNMDKQIRNPSVQVGQNGRPFCSGTIIQSKRDEVTGKVSTGVLTAQHCVKENPFRNFDITVPVYNDSGLVVSRQVYVGKVSKQGSDTNDLALIELADTTSSFAGRVAIVAPKNYNPRAGSSVFVSGYPLGAGWTIVEGRFSSREEFPFPSDSNETEYFRASPAITGGNSGGGLFDQTSDGNYQLIGVADWKAGDRYTPSTFGAYVPVDKISEFITSWSGYKK